MPPLVQIFNLHKSYISGGKPLNVLTGLNFAIEEGEFLSIVGQSGAGKSTLLHLMGALDRPDKGKILFCGKNIYENRASDMDLFRNREIGFIFQFHYLMSEFTALENVMMPALVAKMSLEEAEKESSRILDEVGLADRKDHRPGQLSGGEQQRVAVARALVMSPKIILADEPTGNLDHENSSAIFSLLKEVNVKSRLTFVMVTHNRELAASTDRVLTLAGGIMVDDIGNELKIRN